MIELLTLLTVPLALVAYLIGRIQGEKIAKEKYWDWTVSFYNGKPIRMDK